MQDAFYKEARWLELKLKILDKPAFSATIHHWLTEKKHFPRVLECGTGAGDFILILDQLITYDQVLAFDINSHLLEKARVRFAGNKKIEFLVHNLYEPSTTHIPSDFDLVTGHAMLEHTNIRDAIPILEKYVKPGGYMYFPHNYMAPTIFEPAFDDIIDRQIVQNFDSFSIERQDYGGITTGDSRCGARLYNRFKEFGIEVIHFECTSWLLYPRNKGFSDEEAETLRMIVNFFYSANKSPDIPISLRVSDKILEEWKLTRFSQIEENKLVYICPQTSILVRKPV